MLPRGAKPIKSFAMKYLLLVNLLVFTASAVYAWDGFDADTSDLVAIAPDEVPAAGSTVTVKNYDHDTETRGVVDRVHRNSRTIEVVVTFPDGTRHTLVMEGR